MASTTARNTKQLVTFAVQAWISPMKRTDDGAMCASLTVKAPTFAEALPRIGEAWFKAHKLSGKVGACKVIEHPAERPMNHGRITLSCPTGSITLVCKDARVKRETREDRLIAALRAAGIDPDTIA